VGLFTPLAEGWGTTRPSAYDLHGSARTSPHPRSCRANPPHTDPGPRMGGLNLSQPSLHLIIAVLIVDVPKRSAPPNSTAFFGADRWPFAPSPPATKRCAPYRPCCVDVAAGTYGLNLSSALLGSKRVGLHYIAFSEHRDSKDKTCPVSTFKNRSIRWCRDELRLAGPTRDPSAGLRLPQDDDIKGGREKSSGAPRGPPTTNHYPLTSGQPVICPSQMQLSRA